MKLFRQIIPAIIFFMSTVFSIGCSASEKSSTTDISASEILKLISKGRPVVIEGKHIKGDLLLYEAGSSAKATQMTPSYIDTEIVFSNCVFEDMVNASATINEGKQIIYSVFRRNVTFSECIFMKKATFDYATFEGASVFDNSVFHEETSFNSVDFRGGVNMNKTTFDLDVVLANATIAHHASFHGTKFGNVADMQYLRINGQAFFADAKFNGYTDASNVNIYGELNLSNARFGGRVECISGFFNGNVRFSSTEFVDLVTLSGCRVIGSINTEQATFGGRVKSDNNTIVR